jgi:3-oxoacyl-[acyl-carrier protein] reductase
VELKDKKVIITGGARGIGRNLVEQLINEEASVGIFDIDQERLNELKETYPNVLCLKCDLTDPSQVEASIDKFCEQFGKIDILINNAGILYSAPLVSFGENGLQKHDFKMWDKVISTDLSSVFYMTVHAVEKMVLKRTKGVIVNVSSVSASGNAGQSAYSAAKAGVNALTATWAKELGPMGIRVIGVAPGYTATESTQEVMNEKVLNEIVKKVPLRRLGKAHEISDGIIQIIKNDFFNGKIFEIDGGLLI